MLLPRGGRVGHLLRDDDGLHPRKVRAQAGFDGEKGGVHGEDFELESSGGELSLGGGAGVRELAEQLPAKKLGKRSGGVGGRGDREGDGVQTGAVSGGKRAGEGCGVGECVASKFGECDEAVAEGDEGEDGRRGAARGDNYSFFLPLETRVGDGRAEGAADLADDLFVEMLAGGGEFRDAAADAGNAGDEFGRAVVSNAEGEEAAAATAHRAGDDAKDFFRVPHVTIR
mmetsp:Transcript_13525/g.34409  ORF Transcript_13525/g.34409 Transcript_13525/m.34409 type:complete len:228 (-) Transcript_13525:398-1081(-)